MFIKKTVISISLALAALASCATQAKDINVNGSTTVLPAMQYVAESFMAKHADTKVVISATGSGNGIKALRDNMTDIAMSSRELKAKEFSDFEEHGIHPEKVIVAYDAIIPILNSTNPVKEISMEDLKKVFSGKIRNWKELGGEDAPIVVIGRDSSSGTFECWSELVMKGERVTPRALIQASNGGVSQAVAGNKNAIGYVGIGYVNDKVHGVTVNGIAPSLKAAKEKTWPISRDLLLFTNSTPHDEAKALIDYMTSNEGQALVEKAGFVSIIK